MKRLLLILALLFALPASASIALVGTVTTSATSSTCHKTSTSTGAACTLAQTVTVGNDVVVHVGWHSSSSLKKVIGTTAGAVVFPFYAYAQHTAGSGTTGNYEAFWVCRNCGVLTTVTPTFSTATKYEITVLELSGVPWIGQAALANNGGSASASPGVTLTTGDANNWIICGMGSVGTAGVATARVGTLVNAAQTGSTTSDITVGVSYNGPVVSPASTGCGQTITSKVWSAIGLELRTTAPSSPILSNDAAKGCTTASTTPCIISYKAPPASPQSGGNYGPNFYFWTPTTLANNLLAFIVTRPINCGHTTPGACSATYTAYDKSGNSTGISFTTGAAAVGSSYRTEIIYACGAPAGVYLLKVALSGGTPTGDINQFDLMNVQVVAATGIATTSCGNGSQNATAQAAGAMATTITKTDGTTSGDLILTFGIDGVTTSAPFNNGVSLSGIEQCDDLSDKLGESTYENFLACARVQSGSGNVTTTLNVGGMDVLHQETWQVASQAFKASAGAGTMPSAGAWVVRDQIHWNVKNASTYVSFPTNGNALLLDTTHYDSIYNFTTLADNYGSSFTTNHAATGYISGSPQQAGACYGASGFNRDRIVSYTPNVSSSTILHLLDIVGAKSTGVAAGTSGCIGNKTAASGTQRTVVAPACSSTSMATCPNVVTSDSGTFATPYSFAPTLNSSAYSLVSLILGFGNGPPSGPCLTGALPSGTGVTPPTCSGNMTNYTTVDTIFADGMTDPSHYTTGDWYGYYRTNSSSGFSLDMTTADGVSSPQGGSGVEVAGFEIYGEPAAAGGTVRKRVTVIQQ